ncbi:FAD-dependent oxidoreductase [Streptomyces sp. FXJ1.4098]|nr:FAD-dependent oxidoreductase [Streptomyces sp. FXJ1.4098]
MMLVPRDVVIVGASAAGLATAEALRNKGYDGTLTLVGDEPHLPYDRPPLSKQVLAGDWQPEKVRLRDDAAIARLDADFRLGRSAVGLDTARREVRLNDGAQVAYDSLVIATGVTPRRLPGDDLAGVHVLRTLDDALTLRTHLLARPKVVVVGAGFLGAEVAAVARTMGLEVTLVDPLPVPMHRQFGDRIGQLVAQMHSDRGVELRLGVGVSRFLESAGRVVSVELADGTKLDADLVLVAVGSTPATGWLTDSGLPLGNGVECGARCQAAPASTPPGTSPPGTTRTSVCGCASNTASTPPNRAWPWPPASSANNAPSPPSPISGATSTTPASRPTASSRTRGRDDRARQPGRPQLRRRLRPRGQDRRSARLEQPPRTARTPSTRRRPRPHPASAPK